MNVRTYSCYKKKRVINDKVLTGFHGVAHDIILHFHVLVDSAHTGITAGGSQGGSNKAQEDNSFHLNKNFKKLNFLETSKKKREEIVYLLNKGR